jgi:thiopeptide-type bacteriocin biosynthesis protein
VRAELQTRLDEYITAHPAKPAPEVHRRYTDLSLNNQVRWAHYVPETDRYAGPGGLRIAELHFRDSSDVVLAILGDSGSGHLNLKHLKYVYALQLTAMLALSAGFCGTRLSAFFADQLTHMRVRTSDEETSVRFVATNRSALRRQFGAMVMAYEGRLPLSGDLTLGWLDQTRQTCKALAMALEASGDHYQEVHKRLGVKSKYVHVIQSYIHMTLNRLGFWGPAEKNVLEVLRSVFADLIPPIRSSA